VKIREIAKKTLAAALKAGAEQAEIFVREHREFSTNIRMGEIETLNEAESRSLALRVYRGGRKAVVDSSDFRPEKLESLAAEAVNLAGVTAPDDYHRLPEPELYAKDWPELDLRDGGEGPSTEERIDMARRAENASMEADARIDNSMGARFAQSRGDMVLVTSNGFSGGYPFSVYSMSAVPVAKDSKGDRSRDFWYTRALHAEDLLSPEEVGLRAAERALRMCDARRAPTGEVPVLFEANAAGSLVALIFSCIAGSAVWRKQSYLGDRLGEIVASDKISLVDDPLRPRGLGSQPFDGEGLGVSPLRVIDKGELKHFLLDVESSRRMDMKPTGHGSWGGAVSASNLYIEPGEGTLADLIASTDRGLLVTGYMGSGFNAVSGHWSQGVEGLWIEGGKVVYPVKGATIAGKFDEVLGGIDRVAADLDFSLGSKIAPSLRVRSMTVSGE